MVTLKTSTLTENLGFNCEDITVKSISAAWNEIRKIRDTTEANLLDGTILKIELPDGATSDRIPSTILFKLNKKGKIEFKNADAVKDPTETPKKSTKGKKKEPIFDPQF